MESFEIKFGPETARKGHTQVPNLWLDNYQRLGISTAQMMVIIHSLQRKESEAWPYVAISEIARKTGTVENNIRRHLQALASQGLLNIIERPGKPHVLDWEPLRAAFLSLPEEPPKERAKPWSVKKGSPQQMLPPNKSGGVTIVTPTPQQKWGGPPNKSGGDSEENLRIYKNTTNFPPEGEEDPTTEPGSGNGKRVPFAGETDLGTLKRAATMDPADFAFRKELLLGEKCTGHNAEQIALYYTTEQCEALVRQVRDAKERRKRGDFLKYTASQILNMAAHKNWEPDMEFLDGSAPEPKEMSDEDWEWGSEPDEAALIAARAQWGSK